MRLLILALAAALASFSAAQAQGPVQANCAAQTPQNLALYFADDEAGLTPRDQATLARAAQIAQACPTWTLAITVYPGDSGSAATDNTVAAKRRDAISAALASFGVAPDRLRLITAAAPAGPAAPSVTGAVIAFAAQRLPEIAYALRRPMAPAGAPPPQAVAALPKGPLVVTSSSAPTVVTTATPPSAAPPPAAAPSPTPGPDYSAAPPPAPAPAPAPKLTVTYNAPPSIPLGQDTDYRLIIQSANPAGAADFTGAPGPLASHQIPTLTWAKAVMTGPADQVAIQSQSAPCQQVGSLGNPTWDWIVAPKTNKPFFLTVAIYQVADCNASGVQDVREDTFSIKVTESFWSGLVYEWPAWKSALAWALGTITALGGAFGAWTWLKSNKSSGS